jgi:hypothetical protein
MNSARSSPLKNIFCIAALAAMCLVPIAVRADSFNAVTGITGTDGKLSSVEGNAPFASGANLIATGGEVDLFFAGYAAGDVDLLVNGSQVIFANQITPLGTKFDLGDFTAGTVITLAMKNTVTGDMYYTGPAGSDGLIHSAYAPWTANSAIPENGTFVGFEDLPNGSTDGDYNDLMIVASGVTPTPEPGTLMLLGTGILAMGLLTKRRFATN